MDPVLAVHEIDKTFTGVRAVDRLSFKVGRGEIFALLGPNGAGKTTMVRILLGIIRADGGTVTWHLDGPAAPPDVSRIGYLPEDRGLYKDVPIGRTLTYFGALRGLPRAEARREAMAWLERLDLADRAKDKLDTLSKGNQQKVQFAAAVLHRPSFAVLDEPFSGFDPVNQDRFLDFIRQMRDDGATVLLSAHQMQLVERIADRILLIDRGHEVLAGSLDEVRASAGAGRRLVLEISGEADTTSLATCPGVNHVEDVDRVEGVEGRRIVLRLDDDVPLNPTLDAVGRLVEIRGVHDERPTLHDIYVDAVRRQEAAS